MNEESYVCPLTKYHRNRKSGTKMKNFDQIHMSNLGHEMIFRIVHESRNI